MVSTGVNYFGKLKDAEVEEPSLFVSLSPVLLRHLRATSFIHIWEKGEPVACN